MDKNRPNIAGIVSGQEKFTFIYVVLSAVAITCVVAYSLIASLGWLQSSLLFIGSLLVAWAIAFSFLEVRRAARIAKNGAEEPSKVEADLYASRSVAVAPPTRDPYPHHEDYVESQGFDQGQLTARIPDSTPLIPKSLRPRSDKEKVAR